MAAGAGDKTVSANGEVYRYGTNLQVFAVVRHRNVLARPIANEMSKGLDQPALLEYKPGAGSERRQLGQRLRGRCAAGRDRHELPIPDVRERGRDPRQP